MTQPPNNESVWDSYDALVTWAAWEIVQTLLSGNSSSLKVTVHHIIMVARMAKFKGEGK